MPVQRSTVGVGLAVGIVMAVSVLATASQTLAGRGALMPASAPQAAATPERTPRLPGRVLAVSDRAPLRRVLITITVGGRVHSEGFTGDDGRFDIDIPATVPYVVSASKSGYLAASMPRPARATGGTLEFLLERSNVIGGRVVDPSGHPVVSIRVRAQRTDGAASSEVMTFTDDTGTYRMAGLPPGRYTLTTVGTPEYATGDGMSPSGATTRQPLWETSSEPVSLETRADSPADATLVYRDAAVILPYALVGGVVTGQIADESGEPAAGLRVQLWSLAVVNGTPIAEKYGASRATDDRGQYRLFHVKAGRYVLVVTDESTQTTNHESSWLPVFYPGTSSPASAVPLNVGRSQELAGTDLTFIHDRGARIFGVALNAAGRPLRNVLSLVASSLDSPFVLPARVATVDPDGAFEIASVPPGEYAIRTTPSVRAAARITLTAPVDAEVAMQRVTVGDGDIGPLAIQSAPPATLRGHIVFEGMLPIRTNFDILALTTDPLFDVGGPQGGGVVSLASIDARTWTFEMPRVAGPIRLALSGVSPGTWLKSAYIGSANAAESPVMFMTARDSRDDITVVIAGTGATLTNEAASPAMEQARGVQIVVFSTDRERWFAGSPYVQSIYSDERGQFTLSSLPPGEYWIVAIDSAQPELARRDAERAELLESLTSSARRVTLGEGETRRVTPRVVTMTK